MNQDYATTLLQWFDQHGRHDLPWTQPRTPYRVWLSEIMLQQTQVATVIPYFLRFTRALPDLPALAAAPLDEVLALWSGLGYYSRARNLHAAAQRCMQLHAGELPRDFDALLALPGIGRSTAGAILAQAFAEPFPILDGNVKRSLARLHGIEGWPGLPAVEKTLWQLARQSLPADGQRMADYTQAQMDFGATLCRRSRPLCSACPLAQRCVAQREGRTQQLPAPRPRKTLPERHVNVLWLRDRQGRTLIERRPASGIWAALWSLPEAQNPQQALALARQHADLPAHARLQKAPAIAHVFTHFRLHIQPLLCSEVTAAAHVGDNGHLRWASPAELADLGIPAPIRKLIEQDPSA